jgi:hypothetical protein
MLRRALAQATNGTKSACPAETNFTGKVFLVLFFPKPFSKWVLNQRAQALSLRYAAAFSDCPCSVEFYWLAPPHLAGKDVDMVSDFGL